jgi:hypothetical protein
MVMPEAVDDLSQYLPCVFDLFFGFINVGKPLPDLAYVQPQISQLLMPSFKMIQVPYQIDWVPSLKWSLLPESIKRSQIL